MIAGAPDRKGRTTGAAAGRGCRFAAARRAGNQDTPALRVDTNRFSFCVVTKYRDLALILGATSARSLSRSCSMVSTTPAPRAALVTMSASALTIGNALATATLQPQALRNA
jgi:hypothetical protein